MKNSLIFFTLFSFALMANPPKIQTSNTSKEVYNTVLKLVENRDVNIGESFRAVLEFNQIVTDDFLKALKDKSIGPHFYIGSLEFIKREDLITKVGLLLVYKGTFSYNLISTKHLDQTIVVKIEKPEMFTNEQVKQIKNFNTVDRTYTRPWIEKYKFLIWILVPLITFFILLGCWKLVVNIKTKINLNNRKTELKRHWFNNFEIAHTRDDFERIYQYSSEWKEFVQDELANDFLKIVKNNQYKRSWSDLVKETLKGKVDEMMREIR